MSKLLPLSLFLLLPFFFIISMAADSTSNYTNCPSYNCGNVTISYPFWRMDGNNTTQFCGYKGFGIHCSRSPVDGKERGIISFGGDSYYVKEILYPDRSIFLVDIDVSDPAANLCPRVRRNIQWHNLPFNFSSSTVNLSFHFNCTGIPSFASEIRCLDFGAKKSCFNIADKEPKNFNWGRYTCEEDVVTTVFPEFLNPTNLATDFGQALSQGFELAWGNMSDCSKCEGSDGRCGYNYATRELMCYCSDGRTTTDGCKKGSKINLRLKSIIGAGSALLSIVLICIIYCITKYASSNCATSFKQRTEDDKAVESFMMQYGSVAPQRYKYADIKKITNSFRAKLGQGGFGSVFKGKLSDGRLVAVKVLNSSKTSGQEFINEVASIGRTSHVHIVSLLGFCFDRHKRALIYEFMPNGSLEKFIYRHLPLNTSEPIGVKMLYEIALGIARGLDYLHRGCNTRILHLDIKPHNILLDEDYCPKIADFGLAKLYSRKESIVSMLEARGTIGYIAPEVFNRNFGRVSHKSDVYSYGMMILEMVGGRKNIDAGVGSGRTSEIYFPHWIYNRLDDENFLLNEVPVDENGYARRMTIAGLWCIQSDPTQRPSIHEVIEMLEGSIEALRVPPKPFFSSPPQSPATTYSTQESESGITVTRCSHEV